MIDRDTKIVFHLGPRKCGKSEFVEKELELYSPKLYIGTLDVNKGTLSTILSHRKRRGSNWEVFEISDDFNQDMIRIRKTLDKTIVGLNTACLIDGLLTWFFNTSLQKDDVSVAFFSREIVKLINEFKISWRLINVPQYIYLKEIDLDSLRYYSFCKKINTIISLEIENYVEIIDWTYDTL